MNEVKSILGLFNNFEYVHQLLNSDCFDNPGINLALYQVDLDMLCDLHHLMKSIRETNAAELRDLAIQLFHLKIIDKKYENAVLNKVSYIM